jgi:hypothetical protein
MKYSVFEYLRKGIVMRQAFDSFVRQLVGRYTNNPAITNVVVQAADSLEQQVEQSIGLQPTSGGASGQGGAIGAPSTSGVVVLPYTSDAQQDDAQTNLNGNPLTNDDTHAIYTTQTGYKQVIDFIRKTHAAAGYVNGDISADASGSTWNVDFPATATDLIKAYKCMDVEVSVPDSSGNVLVKVMVHDTSAD